MSQLGCVRCASAPPAGNTVHDAISHRTTYAAAIISGEDTILRLAKKRASGHNYSSPGSTVVMETDFSPNTERRCRGECSYDYATLDNSRSLVGGCFLCAEGQAVPSARWTGFVEPVCCPDPKRNRYRNRARVMTSPSKGRGARRSGATRASHLGGQTRFSLLRQVLRELFPGNGLVVDPACVRRPGPQVMASGVFVAGCEEPRSVKNLDQ
jgi:hypothetical protein